MRVVVDTGQPDPNETGVATVGDGALVNSGSYDGMDTTYDAITNYLDQKGLEAKDLFIEQYVTDPVTTPEDKLVIEVFVPVK